MVTVNIKLSDLGSMPLESTVPVKLEEIGIQAFAKKPIVKEDLAQTVRDVLDGEKD